MSWAFESILKNKEKKQVIKTLGYRQERFILPWGGGGGVIPPKIHSKYLKIITGPPFSTYEPSSIIQKYDQKAS